MANQARLEMIQGIINRMAGNSSAYKGWMVTITAALLGVAINNHKPLLGWLTVYVVCVLAVLDGYYLALERSYRELYRTAEAEGVDKWSLGASPASVGKVLAALKSPSIWIFYGSAVIAAVLVAATS